MMMKHNANNERIKRTYFIFLKEAKRQNEASVDAVAKALNRFETYTKFKDFKLYHYQQAVGFKKHLSNQENEKTGKRLSKATLHSTFRHLKIFFQWLAMQSGYKSRLNYTDMEYFNLSEKDTRVATAKRLKPIPTVEQIKHVVSNMTTDTVIQQRNRALIVFILLSGMRDSAVASIKLKHLDFSADSIFQDAREVNTKYSKTFTSYFFPVGDDLRQIVFDWVTYLKNDLLYGNDDPLFPKTRLKQNDVQEFTAVGVKNECWTTASPIRSIFRESFESVGLPYFNPHSFRKTLVGLGQQICQTPEEFKAWSQNLGHEGVLTTFCSYGEVQPQKQSEIFQQLKSPRQSELGGVTELAKALAKEMNKQNGG